MSAVTLYTFSTPNGYKASVTLEELGIDYDVQTVDITKGQQKEDWYLKINPNGRIPAIVDHNNGDCAVFETGAIMIYLEERYGKGDLLPKEGKERYEVLEWLMFQMGGLGPMMGQNNYFLHMAPEKFAFSQNRYLNESKRLLGVLENRLKDREYLAGDKYSLADIANFCWAIVASFGAVDIDKYPSVKAWTHRIYARTAVAKGIVVPKEFFIPPDVVDEEKRKQTVAANIAKLAEPPTE